MWKLSSDGKLPCSFGIAACPSDALALTNKLIVNGQDFPPHVEYVRLKGKYVMAIL